MSRRPPLIAAIAIQNGDRGQIGGVGHELSCNQVMIMSCTQPRSQAPKRITALLHTLHPQPARAACLAQIADNMAT